MWMVTKVISDNDFILTCKLGPSGRGVKRGKIKWHNMGIILVILKVAELILNNDFIEMYSGRKARRQW